jgi:hypothetical protein
MPYPSAPVVRLYRHVRSMSVARGVSIVVGRVWQAEVEAGVWSSPDRKLRCITMTEETRRENSRFT